MSESKAAHPEQLREQEIVTEIKVLHEAFLRRVPHYQKNKWDPRLALRDKTGSCMAELLYVAGGLLAKGISKEADITVGFSKSHGEEEPIGFVGRAGKKYAHTFMLITTGGGVTLEVDFRANRADEDPRIQRLLPDELNPDSLILEPLADAVAQYARVDGISGPTVSELIGLHFYGEESTQEGAPSSSIPGTVSFDEDF